MDLIDCCNKPLHAAHRTSAACTADDESVSNRRWLKVTRHLCSHDADADQSTHHKRTAAHCCQHPHALMVQPAEAQGFNIARVPFIRLLKEQPFASLKVLYFLFYASLSVVLPFLAVYYKSVGLSYPQIGVLGALAPMIALVRRYIFA